MRTTTLKSWAKRLASSTTKPYVAERHLLGETDKGGKNELFREAAQDGSHLARGALGRDSLRMPPGSYGASHPIAEQ